METQYQVSYTVNVNAGSSVAQLKALSEQFKALSESTKVLTNEGNVTRAAQNFKRLGGAFTEVLGQKGIDQKKIKANIANFQSFTNTLTAFGESISKSTIDSNKIQAMGKMSKTLSNAITAFNAIPPSNQNVGVAIQNFTTSFGSVISLFSKMQGVQLNGATSKVTSAANAVAKAMTTIGAVNIPKANLTNARNAMGILSEYNKIVMQAQNMGTGGNKTVSPIRSYTASLNSMFSTIQKLSSSDTKTAFNNIAKMFGKMSGMEKAGAFSIDIDNSIALAKIYEVKMRAEELQGILSSMKMGSLGKSDKKDKNKSSGVTNIGTQRKPIGFIQPDDPNKPTDLASTMPYMGRGKPKVGKGTYGAPISSGITNISNTPNGALNWAQYQSTLRYPAGFAVGQEQRYQAWAKWAKGAEKYPEFKNYVNQDATLKEWYSRFAQDRAAANMVKTINTPPFKGLLPAGSPTSIPLNTALLNQAANMSFNSFRKMYPLVSRDEALNYWRNARATFGSGFIPSGIQYAGPGATATSTSASAAPRGSASSTSAPTAPPPPRTPVGTALKTRYKNWMPRNVGYKVLGPSMLDSGGLGVASLLQGMGLMYGISGAFSMFGQSLRDYMEYNNIMQTAMNILHAHDTQGNFYGRFGEMANTVRRVGVETKFTAPQVADAAKFLAMAGYDISQINSAIRPIADIALVGDTELGTTADLMTNVMTAYKIKPDQVRQAADIMTNTFTMSNTTLTEMAESYKYSAGLLAANNVSFQESAAALGILGNAGIKGSQAGTTMRTIIANLVNPKNSEEWKRLGIKIKTESGDLRSLTSIFGDLAKREDVDVYKLFHKTAAQGAVALMDQVDRWNEIIAQNFLSEGMVAKLADAKKNTISGLWAQLTSMFTEDAIQAFDGVNGTITNFLKSGVNALDPNSGSGAAENIRKTFTQIVGLLDEVKNISKVIFGTWQHIGGFVTTFWKFQMMAMPLLFGMRGIKSLFNMGAGAVGLAGSIGNFAGGLGLGIARFKGKSKVEHSGGRKALDLFMGPASGVSRSSYSTRNITYKDMILGGFKPQMKPNDWRNTALSAPTSLISAPVLTPAQESANKLYNTRNKFLSDRSKKNAQAYWNAKNEYANSSSDLISQANKRAAHITQLRKLAIRRQTLTPVMSGISGMAGMVGGGYLGSTLATSLGAEQGGFGQMFGASVGGAAGMLGVSKLGAGLGNLVATFPMVGVIAAALAAVGWLGVSWYKADKQAKQYMENASAYYKEMYGDARTLGMDASDQMNKYLIALNKNQGDLNDKKRTFIEMLKEEAGLVAKANGGATGLPLSQVAPGIAARAEEMNDNRHWYNSFWNRTRRSLGLGTDTKFESYPDGFSVVGANKNSFANFVRFKSGSRGFVNIPVGNYDIGKTRFKDIGAAALAWDAGIKMSGQDAIYSDIYSDWINKLMFSPNYEETVAELNAYIKNMYDTRNKATEGYTLDDFRKSTDIEKNTAAILAFSTNWANILNNPNNDTYRQIQAGRNLIALSKDYDVNTAMSPELRQAMSDFAASKFLSKDMYNQMGNSVLSLKYFENTENGKYAYRGHFDSPEQDRLYNAYWNKIQATFPQRLRYLIAPWKEAELGANNEFLTALQTPYIGPDQQFVTVGNDSYRFIPEKKRYVLKSLLDKNGNLKPGVTLNSSNSKTYPEMQRSQAQMQADEWTNQINQYSPTAVPGSDDSEAFNWRNIRFDQSDFAPRDGMFSDMADKPTYASNTVTYQPNAVNINIFNDGRVTVDGSSPDAASQELNNTIATLNYALASMA